MCLVSDVIRIGPSHFVSHIFVSLGEGGGGEQVIWINNWNNCNYMNCNFCMAIKPESKSWGGGGVITMLGLQYSAERKTCYTIAGAAASAAAAAPSQQQQQQQQQQAAAAATWHRSKWWKWYLKNLMMNWQNIICVALLGTPHVANKFRPRAKSKNASAKIQIRQYYFSFSEHSQKAIPAKFKI